MITPIKDEEITRETFMFSRRWIHYKDVMWITNRKRPMTIPDVGEVILEQYGSVENKSITHRTNLWSYTLYSKTHYFYNDTEDFATAREEAVEYVRYAERKR